MSRGRAASRRTICSTRCPWNDWTMRSTRHAPRLLAALIAVWVLGWAGHAVAESLPHLDIEPDGDGVHSHGAIWLPDSPDAIRAILTDYEHWPELFPGRFELIAI